jgi:hypothetical protein
MGKECGILTQVVEIIFLSGIESCGSCSPRSGASVESSP